MTVHLGLAAFDFAGFLIVSAVAQFLEGAFLVQFLFQTAERALNRFTFLYADFSVHGFFTPFQYFAVDIRLIYHKKRKSQEIFFIF